jgi:cell division protein FtsB
VADSEELEEEVQQLKAHGRDLADEVTNLANSLKFTEDYIAEILLGTIKK